MVKHKADAVDTHDCTFEDHIEKELQSYAKEHDLSNCDVIRESVEHFLDKHKECKEED
jgi:hypothetical protein